MHTQQGTALFFHVPFRDKQEMLAELSSCYISALASNPRPALKAIQIAVSPRDLIPVVAIDWEVNKVFETQAGVIYRARESSRKLFPLHNDDRNALEEEFWKYSHFELFPEKVIQGKAVATYFGRSIEAYRQVVIQEVTSRLSRNVSYAGRNNHSYTKYCEVKSNDISITTKQVLLVRQTARLMVGPQHYTISFADDRTRSWAVSSTTGFTYGPEGFLNGNGIICNDCDLISPPSGSHAGSYCAVCGRTLCKSHQWTWPKKAPRRWLPLCAECYRIEDVQADYLHTSLSLLSSIFLTSLLACLPGLPFLLGKRILLGIMLLSVSVGFALYVPEALLVCAILSIASAVYWSIRLRHHTKNLEELQTYQRAWRQGSAIESAPNSQRWFHNFL